MDRTKNLRLEIKYDLWILIFLYFLLLLTTYVSPVPALRIILGLFCLLFVPGYTLLAALFPLSDHLHGAVRAALSFGLSILIVSLLGLGLSYTPWGIRLESTLLVVGLFTFACSGAASHRRRTIPPEKRFSVALQFDVSRWQALEALDKFLSVALVLSMLAIMSALVYGISKPKISEKFTEFYVLGSGTKADGYPEEIAAGKPLTLIVGVINREHDDVHYRIDRAGVAGRERVAALFLRHDEKWEQSYTFILTEPGENQKVEFLLYKGDEEEPYRSLHLWITVKED